MKTIARELVEALRTKHPHIKFPLVMFYAGYGGTWRWTLFAGNGKIIDSSNERFSSRKEAVKNYNTIRCLMYDLHGVENGRSTVGHLFVASRQRKLLLGKFD